MAFFNSEALKLSPFSPSKLSTLDRCGLQMHYKYVLKLKEEDIPENLSVEVDNSAALLGTALHLTSEYMAEGMDLESSINKALEECPTTEEVEEEVRMYKYSVASFQDRLSSFKKTFKVSKEFREIELAIDKDLSPCSFWDSKAVLRGKSDCILISEDGKSAVVIDLKSSKRATMKYAQDQLDFYSLLVFSNFPQVQEVKNGLFFLKHGKMLWSNTLLKRGLWDGASLIAKVNTLSKAFLESLEPELNQSPLCNYCIYKGLCGKEMADRKSS